MYENENRDPEKRSDGTYRYARPESREMLYRDATIEPCDNSARMPHYYEPPAPPEPDVQAPPSAPPEEQVTPKVMQRFWTKIIAMCTACALIGGLIGGGVTAWMIHNSHSVPGQLSINNSPTPTDGSFDTIVSTPIPTNDMSPAQIYENACAEVVGITTEVTYHNLFGMTVSQPVSGTGFFISENGYVLTNYHVVEYAVMYNKPAKVITYDGNRYDGIVVGYDSDNDIAVLHVNASGLEFATLGNSDSIHVGDAVYAVGNPLGELQFSMTTGSVSATDRLISTEDASPAINMFQIDAAVNNGNSGGPVYDRQGSVVGVVTAKYSETGIEGIGFAIPINDALSIANDLITQGYVSGKAKLGVDAQTMSARAAMYYGSVEGAYIRYITPGSCAEEAGLQLGDVVYRFGDLEVLSRDDLQAAVRSYHAGDMVELAVFREGEHMTIIVTLDEDIPTEGLASTIAHDHFTGIF